MLEINFFQQDNESLTNKPTKFTLSQLKNGNYVLSNFGDHYRLKSVLSTYEQKHLIIENIEEKYNQFLISNQKAFANLLEGSTVEKDFVSESDSNFTLDSFSVESKNDEYFNIMLNIKNNTKSISYEEYPNEVKKVKCPYGNLVFIGCEFGVLFEYSMNEKRIVRDFGQTFQENIYAMTKTFDNKSLFVSDCLGSFGEFDILTCKQVNKLEVKVLTFCVITCDNKFLVTSEYHEDTKTEILVKYSMRTKKQLYIGDINFYDYVTS